MKHLFKKKTSKRTKSLSKKLTGYYITEKSGKRDTDVDSKTKIKRQFFEIIDVFTNEFDARFTENEDVLTSLNGFAVSSSSNFLKYSELQPFIERYTNFFTVELIEGQLKMAKLFLDEKNEICDMLVSLEKFPETYSEVIKMMKIVVTLPVTTAGNERFFSSLKFVKNFLRTTTGDERLSNLMLMSVKKKLVKSLDLDLLTDKFAEVRNRRYPLK